MSDRPDDQRRRDLECDRIMSAGLCMGATAIVASRIIATAPAAAALFEPRDASAIFAPIIWLAATCFSVLLLLIAAGENRRPLAAAAVLGAALTLAIGVPYALHALRTLIAKATLPWTAGAVALVTFGLVASLAVEETRASAGHARFSAGITVLALLMAATDPLGAFACILAALGFLFFSLYRVPAKG